MKVMTILGTRPEIIRLSRVMARLDEAPGIEHLIVHTGQNYDYELNEIFFSDLEVRAPDHFLNVSRTSLGSAYGDILAKSEQVMRDESPDAVLILGDTNSAIAAIIAKRLHIPTFHMEAGNRSFDQNVPEEVNRRIVDHTADFNLVYTEHARRNLLREGLPSRNIYLTGSPMREVIENQRRKISESETTRDLGLTVGEFYLVSAHREENVDHEQRLTQLLDSLEALHEEDGRPVVVSLHPRTRNRIESLGRNLSRGLLIHAPFGFSAYCRLQLDARCVLSDSGTIAEESAILGFPAVTLRNSIERPEALDTGAILLTGLKADDIVRAVDVAVATRGQADVPTEYSVENCSFRVLALIVSLAPQAKLWHGLY